LAGNVLIDIADTNGLAAGTEAPAIDVKQPGGTKLTLADFRGRYVLLHFWDSTSKESAEQMPHLRAAHRDWGNEPKLAIVGINVDEKPEAATGFAKEQKMEWTQGYAGAGMKLMKDFHVGVGAAVLIGPDGKIVAGSLQGLAIDDALDKALRRQ
jgi:peroxiredoxin